MESDVVVVAVVLIVVDDVDVGEICMGDELVAVIYRLLNRTYRETFFVD